MFVLPGGVLQAQAYDWAVRYLVLATDYDETIATHGHLGDAERAALSDDRRAGHELSSASVVTNAYACGRNGRAEGA